MPDITYFWEDMAVGQVRDLGAISPSREDIIAFASQFDPQPFHLDAAAGAASVFGGLCASGWHTCSMAMRLMVTNFLQQTSSLGSPGLENIQWKKPVYPNDTLRLQTTVLETKPMGRRPDVGIPQFVGDVQPAWRQGVAYGGLGYVQTPPSCDP
jgi:acyl dehydratase